MVEEQIKVSNSFTNFRRRLSLVGDGIRRMSVSIVNQARRLSLSLNNKVTSSSSSDISNSELQKKVESVKTTILVLPEFVNIRKKIINYHTAGGKISNESDDIVNSNVGNEFDISMATYQEFTEAFKRYRRSLSLNEKFDFDSQWKKLFSSEVIDTAVDVSSSSYNPFFKFSHTAFSEILEIQQESSKIFERIKDSPTHILGAEMMKLFMQDLLGRKTPAAKIFETAMEANLKSVRVVSRPLKYTMIFFVICINIYFCFATLQYSKGKSKDWQLIWLRTVLVNLGVDVVFNCLTEALFLKYLVPRSISSETYEMKKKLNTIVSNFAQNSQSHDSRNSSPRTFSSPKYFYVSADIAKRRPYLQESALILSYV